jgi:hypothetical protein
LRQDAIVTAGDYAAGRADSYGEGVSGQFTDRLVVVDPVGKSGTPASQSSMPHSGSCQASLRIAGASWGVGGSGLVRRGAGASTNSAGLTYR